MEGMRSLEEYGLTANQARTYLASLALGPASAQEIAQKTGLLRTTTYEILKQLQNLGVETSYEQSGRIHWDAAPPSALMRALKERVRRFEESVPLLESMRGTAERKPKIEMYAGKEGVFSLLREQLRCGGEVFLLANTAQSDRFLGPRKQEYVGERVRKKIPMTLVCEPGKGARAFQRTDAEELRATHTAAVCSELESSFLVFADKVAIITFLKQDPVGMLIHNKHVANSFRKIFESLAGKA